MIMTKNTWRVGFPERFEVKKITETCYGIVTPERFMDDIMAELDEQEWVIEAADRLDSILVYISRAYNYPPGDPLETLRMLAARHIHDLVDAVSVTLNPVKEPEDLDRAPAGAEDCGHWPGPFTSELNDVLKQWAKHVDGVKLAA